jgi:hypothetical protein
MLLPLLLLSSCLHGVATLALHLGKILYLSLSAFFAWLVNHWFGKRIYVDIGADCGDEINSSVACRMLSTQASSYYFANVCG